MEIKSQNSKSYFSENKININKSNNNNSQIHDSKNICNSKNYFKLYKEIENSQNNSFKKQKIKKNSKVLPNSLNEKIYSNYSKKLGDYYHKNKEDLYLYGSKKYDLLTVDNLVEEMKQYKNTVIENIKQNPNKLKNKNYGLESNDDSLILTPLAEKERSKMGNNEKEQFNAAERFGVVMRRIEYTNLLSQNGVSPDENGKVFFIMKDAIAKIEKCWLFYKYSKKRRLFRGMKLLEKYIKRKILNLFDYLNNEKLKCIYMSHNPSMLSFKNDLDSTNTNNQKLKNSNSNSNSNNNSNRNYNDNNYQNNNFNNSINDDDNSNDINNNNKNGEIKIEEKQKKPKDDFKKEYTQIILKYKMQQEKLNKYENENFNLKNKINSLMKEIDILKKEKDDLIKKNERISENYNKLLKDNEILNQNYTNLLNNNQMKTNTANENTFSIHENEEYLSLLNKYNKLNEDYNNLLKDYENIKNKCQDLNNFINLQNEQQSKNDDNITNQFISLEEEIKEYKEKNESLNNELLKTKNDYELLINNLNIKINQFTKEKNELQYPMDLNDIKNNNNKEYINQIELLKNKINEYENKIKEYENKENNVYPKQINELKNKNESYEKQILFLKSQIEINKNENIEIKNEEQLDNLNKNKDESNINNENIINENINLKKEINSYKSNIINLNKNLEEYKLKIEETEEKLNIYIINNKKLLEENNNFKITCNKLNNLINGINVRIKQLLEENKNIKRNKGFCLNNSIAKYFNKLFILFIDALWKKKIIEYKFHLIIILQKDYIDNSSKYIIYQTNSGKNSLNFDGYEKVITGESKKVILKENNKSREISYDNKILIHQDLDDTLKDYITKGKDNFMFEEIFDDRKIKNYNAINYNNNIYK